MAQRVTEEEKVKMRSLQAEGMDHQEIAAIVGRSAAGVRCILNLEAAVKHAAQATIYYQKHKAEAAAYRQGHKVERMAYMQAYNQTHKVERMAYRQEHKVETAAYYQKHKPEIVTRRAGWYQIHKAERVIKAIAYRQKHRAESRASDARRHALRNGSKIDDDTEALKAVYVHAASSNPVRCYLCGEFIPQDKRHVDHIAPLSRGGAHVSSNLAIACATCNVSKNARTLEEYRRYQLMMKAQKEKNGKVYPSPFDHSKECRLSAVL